MICAGCVSCHPINMAFAARELKAEFQTDPLPDIVRLRTNVRKENVALYPVAMQPLARQELFLSYVRAANALASSPRFYNTVTANCTTVAFDLARLVQPGIPFDWRILLSGYLPDYLADHDALAWSKPRGDLRERASIDERANAVKAGTDFSEAIRVTPMEDHFPTDLFNAPREISTEP